MHSGQAAEAGAAGEKNEESQIVFETSEVGSRVAAVLPLSVDKSKLTRRG